MQSHNEITQSDSKEIRDAQANFEITALIQIVEKLTLNTQAPKIAVIIVNYNVVFFLEQCLNSVAKAMEYEPAEVWVVDNQSVDGSVAMVREKFPWVKLIANENNVGFSKANNQAMQQSGCKYQLLLNPDTVIEEDTLKKVVDYMEANPDVGGLGVRMVDGKGVFLPESKRGLPTPAVAFYKISGLSRIFPKSKRFARYHMGNLSEFETNDIEILSGAFMLMRKEALDKVGLLDEAFFMYGEDIDLSYRIIQGGYRNVYFPETRIIHYKGESTKKSSVNYVFVFYRAMVIFAKKHFSQNNAQLFSFFINAAIYFRAGLALLNRFIRTVTLPLVDLAYLYFGMMALTHHWKKANIIFPEKETSYLILAYTLVWFLCALFQGVYDLPTKLKRSVFGVGIGTGIILMFYAVLPKDWQFSRLFIFVGALWVLSYYVLSRIFLHFTLRKRFIINGRKNSNFAVIGSEAEFGRVSELVRSTQPKIDKIIHVWPKQTETESDLKLEQLQQIVQVHEIDEVIFCAKDTTATDIIHWIIAVDKQHVDFKIAQPDSTFLIGSNSIETAGDLYILSINALSEPIKQRHKRVIDVFTGLVLLIGYPILCWFYVSKKQLFLNALHCIFGKVTCVGYGKTGMSKSDLPRLKKGILVPYNEEMVTDEAMITKMNLLYAREYHFLLDTQLILRKWKKLDNLPL